MANGVLSPGPDGVILLEDAIDLWHWYVQAKKTPPPARWVDEWEGADSGASVESIM